MTACAITGKKKPIGQRATTEVGGLILSPLTSRLFCAYPVDGNSLNHNCPTLGGDGRSCIPGCYPAGQQCQDVVDAQPWLIYAGCSYPPERLADALRKQQAPELALSDDGAADNNEVVVDLSSYLPHLPEAIEAFFITPTSQGARCAPPEYDSCTTHRDLVETARRDFVSQYYSHADASLAPPLVLLDLTANPPLTLVE